MPLLFGLPAIFAAWMPGMFLAIGVQTTLWTPQILRMNSSIPTLEILAPPRGLETSIPASFPLEPIVFGLTPSMQAVRHEVERVAKTDLPVLIQGESGTGKEIVARLIHAKSSYTGRFVKLNCPTGSVESVASELFGHERAAFTSTNGYKPGKLGLASGDTLFLDEIADLDDAVQVRLLQFLQDARAGATDDQHENQLGVRIICASSRDIGQGLAVGTFRQDLFEHISSVNLHLTPLRNRSVDIPDLAEYFLTVFGEKFNCHARRLSAHLMHAMQQCHWPGNITQLKNLMKWYVICGCEKVIESELTARQVVGNYDLRSIPLDGRFSLKKITREVVREVEGRIILEILQANHWNRRRTARALNISYRALSYKIKEAHLVRSGASQEFEENRKGI